MLIFATHRLDLRPLGEGDEALYCRLYIDPEVMRHIGAPLSLGAAQRAFRAVTRATQRSAPSLCSWVLSERASSADIGILALIGQGDIAGTAEIGTMLVPAAQGRGLAVEAQTVLLDHLFNDPGLRMVWSRNAPGNGAAIGVRLKLGFMRVDTVDDDIHEVRWEMTRDRWGTCRLGAGMEKRDEHR